MVNSLELGLDPVNSDSDGDGFIDGRRQSLAEAFHRVHGYPSQMLRVNRLSPED